MTSSLYLLGVLALVTSLLLLWARRVDLQQRGEWAAIPWYAATFVSLVVTLAASLHALLEFLS